MKPVNQTLFGNGTGNCFAACVASILELPIEEVPNFCVDYPEPQDWYAVFRAWCTERGVIAMPVVCAASPEEAAPSIFGWIADEFPSLPYVVTGETEGGPHCVVHQAGKPIHDPNPRRSTPGVLSAIKMILFLVRPPMDPYAVKLDLRDRGIEDRVTRMAAAGREL